MTSKHLPKNFNVIWLGATMLCIWFLFIHSPPLLIQMRVIYDPTFLIHLIGSYIIYLVCVWNTLFTPTTLNGKGRVLHVYLGRLGMIAGLIGCVLGFYISWSPFRVDKPSLGVAIGLSVGGTFQLIFQVKGYRAIRQYKMFKSQIEASQEGIDVGDLIAKKDAALEDHIQSMIGVFLGACSIPAAVRVAALFSDPNSTIFLVAAIVFLNVCIKYHIEFFEKQRASNRTAGITTNLIPRME